MGKTVCFIIALAAIACMGKMGQEPQKPVQQPVQAWPEITAEEPVHSAGWPKERYNGYEVVRWVDAYNVILRINGEDVGVSVQPEPADWSPMVDWDEFDDMLEALDGPAVG